ncbi:MULTISPECIES: restriction endonuclease subunit S [unclassified Pseudomonas]|uniref:restriction endonuclease subunit S n=1 Tax=unclassified Pseudomonas TaxID=196821 RepID=UPI0035C1A6DD
MTLPRYQELKDSGIDYLGAIPSTWSIKRLGDIVSFAQGKAHEPYIDDDGDYICVNSRFVSTAGKTLKKCTVNLTPASLNDILMVMSDLPNGRALARAYYVRDNGKYAVNQRVCRITAEKADSSFLFYLLDRHPGLMQNDDGVHQTHLSNDDFLKLKLYLPSFSEQIQIARFLDHETARIDALIEEQQRLIELLKEKRQAVISHAVTKGLDPTVPMKDSGVEWLGEVPAHWEVWKLSHAFDGIGSGTTPPSTEHGWYEGGTIPWITTSELRENVITATKKNVTAEALEKFSALQMHPPGSLAIAMYGATIGRLGILGISATTNQACCVLSSPRSLTPGFTFYWLSGFKEIIISLYATGGGQPNINQDTVASLKVPAPGIEEQRGISDFLDQKAIEHDSLVKEAERVVAFLQERRSALISAAVTGKIDVRGWQPPVSTQAPKLEVAEAN